MAHTYNPNTQEPVAGEGLLEVQGQPGLHKTTQNYKIRLYDYKVGFHLLCSMLYINVKNHSITSII